MASGRGDHVARAAIEALEQRIRRDIPYRDRGQFKRQLTELIDRSPSYFDQIRRKDQRGGHITLADWIELSHAVGLDPVDALADIIRPPGESTILPLKPAGSPPSAVQAALRRFRSSPPRARSEPTADEFAVLTRIDRTRYDSPGKAIRQAENAIETIAVDLIPQLLGVLGSSYRMKISYLDDAEHAIRAGLDLAKNDLGIRGDLLQRLGYVLGERGQFHSALRIARSALSVHADHGNLARVGQCLVDTGVFRFHLEDYEGAIQAQESALVWVAEGDLVHRCAALQGLGLYYQRLNQTHKAHRYCGQASELAETLGQTAQIRLQWLQASIENDLKNFTSAEGHYRRVLEHFRLQHSPPDIALVSLDLVRMLLEVGRKGEAKRLARSMLPLCGKTKNLDIRRVIMELNRHGGNGITTNRVSTARSELRRGQIRPRPG